MKRIIFGVIVMLVIITNVQAKTSDYKIQYSDGVNTYLVDLPDITNEFELFIGDNIVPISDYQNIHNMAYYGSRYGDYERILAQEMIWETVYPEYTFDLIDQENRVMDISFFRNIFVNFVDYFSDICSLNERVDEINYGDELIIEHQFTLGDYKTDKTFLTIDNKTITFDSNIPVGNYEITYYVTENINNNKIIARDLNMGTFKTYLNVLGNKIIFNTDNTYIFEMYDVDTNELLGTYEINDTNNTIDYNINHNVILKDITNSSIYEKHDDIIIYENATNTYNISLVSTKQQRSILFSAPFINDNYNSVNVRIYENDTLVDNVICKETCNICLPIGIYKIINNNTLEEYTIDLNESIEIELNTNYVEEPVEVIIIDIPNTEDNITYEAYYIKRKYNYITNTIYY